jgi:hypothetical protein
MATARSSIGPEDYEDSMFPKRGYTTRGKLEQQRNSQPVFTGLVRRWEKKWVTQGHMTVLKWERVKADGAANGRGVEASEAPVAEPSRKRPRASS